MVESGWQLGNYLSLIIGIAIGIFALFRLLIRLIIKISNAFKAISSNTIVITQHTIDTDEKFKDLNIKVNVIGEKIDKIYTILINKS